MVDLEREVKHYDEILQMFKPTLNKKPLKGLKYALDTVRKITDFVTNTLLNPTSNVNKRTKKQKKTRETKKSKRSSSVLSNASSSSASSSDSSSSSSSSSSGSDFEDLFEKPKKQDFIVSQEIVYRNKSRRIKTCSPGEKELI